MKNIRKNYVGIIDDIILISIYDGQVEKIDLSTKNIRIRHQWVVLIDLNQLCM